MRKESLNPGDVDKRYRELLKCVPITVAELDQIPANKGGVYCFYWAGAVKGKEGLEGKSFDAPAPFGRSPTDVLIN